MAVHSFQKIQCIPASLEKVWDFFADPSKLPSITPPYMRFEVLSRDPGDRIYSGQIIEYRVSPLSWLRVYWMTDIVHYEIPYGFIGGWANALFVRRRLEQLFSYRYKRIEEFFGVGACDPGDPR
jgi:ligand-binding SRPBCC domain-containing protein